MTVTKRKRKQNPYRAEVFVSGVRVDSRSFETAAAAHSWHDITKRRWESGRGASSQLTLGELIAAYREKEVSQLATSTQRTTRQRLDFVAEAPMMARRMDTVDSRAVDDLLDWMLDHPRASTPTRTSFVKELKALRAALNYFHDERDETFVMPVTKRHFKRAKFKTVVPRRRDFFIAPDKLNPWLEALGQARDPVYRALATVQVVMGFRIGELVSLCWDAVDFEKGLLHVKRTMDWRDVSGKRIREPADRTKTETSARTLPMPAIVRRVLLAAKQRDPLSTLVFRTRRGQVLRDDTVRDNYKRAFEAVGLAWTGTHICRHTNGTLGVRDSGAEAVQANLGHSSMRETLGYAKIHAMIENSVPGNVADFIDGGSEDVHAHFHARHRSGAKKSKSNGR